MKRQDHSADRGSKSFFDRIIAAAGLVISSPLFLSIAIAVKLYGGGPVFYRALRVGQDGRLFRLFKFRSMRQNADRVGPAITAHQDPRITPVGRLLRRTKLDELPQLFNVLVGDMSLVGPRPEDPRYVALYTPDQRQILWVLPGITSAASLEYRHEEQMLQGADWDRFYREHVMPAKLAIDLAYVSQRTFFTDLALIGRTVLSMFK